jgi:hypothetical protein
MAATHISWGRLGRVAYGLGVAALGGEMVVTRSFRAELMPMPGWLPARAALACVIGVAGVAAGLAIVDGRPARRVARGVTGAMWLSTLALLIPQLLANLRDAGAWTCVFEAIAIGGGGAVLGWPERPALGRIAFGASLPVFAVLHHLFRDYIVSVLPSWLPGNGLCWTYFTAAAHLAAGLSLVTGVLARLAAILAGIMFGTWVVVLHAPRIATTPSSSDEWTSGLIALAMCGGAWLIADARRA